MPGKVFFISDTHFFHGNMLCFENSSRKDKFSSIEEMHNYIVKQWNSVVTDNDKVYHLGDVALAIEGREKELFSLIRSLAGTKVLVAGNHDNAPNKLDIYNDCFSAIVGCIEYKRAILTHIPAHRSQLEHRFSYNIHGHLHDHRVMLKKMDGEAPDDKYICVSCEQVDYTPRTYDELVKGE